METVDFKLGKDFYLLRRSVKARCSRYKELEQVEGGMEKVAELAELRSRLKSSLKTIEGMVERHLMNPGISEVLTLKLNVICALQTPRTSHVLHHKDNPKRLKYVSKTSKPQDQPFKESIRSKQKPRKPRTQPVKDPAAKQNTFLNTDQHRLKVTNRSSIPSEIPNTANIPNKASLKSKVVSRYSTSKPTQINHQTGNELGSTVITIKISKEDYYQLIQSRHSAQLSQSDLLSNIEQSLSE